MPRPRTPARITFGEFVRSQLRDDDLRNTLERMETHMARASEQLTELQTAFADFRADVDAKLTQLEATQGQFDAEAQTVFDSLRASVADADAKLGDADGSDTPAPVEPAPVDEGTPAESTEPTGDNTNV